jgi:hypothetical protein
VHPGKRALGFRCSEARLAAASLQPDADPPIGFHAINGASCIEIRVRWGGTDVTRSVGHVLAVVSKV